MSIGFKGFAKPRSLDTDIAQSQASNVSADEYIIWTGNQYGRRRASGRSACLGTVTEAMTPVALSEYVKRTQKVADGQGFDTAISIGGLSLHQIAKPTVYFYCIKGADGSFRAKRDVPNPDPAHFPDPLKAGDLVLAAKGKKVKGSKGQAVVKA